MKPLILLSLSIIITLGAVYASYRYSQSKSSEIVLPGGITYLGVSPTPANPPVGRDQPPTAPLRFTAPKDVQWLTFAGKLYPYSFSYPATLTLVVFPGDVNDSVGISWGNIPAQQNILLNMEFIDKRDQTLVGKPKVEFVKSWYKYFSGLKGTTKLEPFENSSGLKGYRAFFTNSANFSPNIDVFLDVPNDQNKMIHLANGVFDPEIFERIVDSVKWNAK